ncbi:MAG: hypothetical protein K8T90_09080 [Planctomycetes bacterium]|nr:hypothetical protein [Planctomycetota bacterium]
MTSTSVHQAVHGYRDGHKLLSSSTPLSSDAARAMLVLSDMSGPSMQPGFDEYITGYPLAGAEYFVLAKTWYAPEMPRPGCVWTHSLLIPRKQVAEVSTASLMRSFRRPLADRVSELVAAPIHIEEDMHTGHVSACFGDRALAAAVIGAVLGQPRPVIVVADTAVQFERVFLRLWEELWPAERSRFSFCTGALMPRSNAGMLLDVQAVPRAIPPSQFRKSASAALVLDFRVAGRPEPWVDEVLDRALSADTTLRSWLGAAAGPETGRAIVSSLAPLFGAWHAPGLSSQSVLAIVVGAKDLDVGARRRLVGMLFDRAYTESGAAGLQELLQVLCAQRDQDLAWIASVLEDQTKRLFEESRFHGIQLVFSLLGGELNDVGEHLLRTAVLLLVPNDIQAIGDEQAPFLPTIVSANPALARSPVLWQRVGARAIDVLSQLGTANLEEEARGAVIDAIFTSGRDVSVDAIVRFGGKVAITRALSALASNQILLSWQWRTVLSAQPNAVLEWLESLRNPSLLDLDLGSRFVSPRAAQLRLAMVWKSGTANSGSVAPRVAAFGLTLALWEADESSPLLAVCFQPTYDAAGSSRLEYEEWDWLREQAPAVSWYRDWDRCERLAAALARLLERRNASLETVFGIVRSRPAIREVAAVLDDEKGTRPYLRALREAAESSSVGTCEQRDALLEDW